MNWEGMDCVPLCPECEASLDLNQPDLLPFAGRRVVRCPGCGVVCIVWVGAQGGKVYSLFRSRNCRADSTPIPAK